MTSPPAPCACGPVPPIQDGARRHAVLVSRGHPRKWGLRVHQFALVHAVHYNSHADR